MHKPDETLHLFVEMLHKTEAKRFGLITGDPGPPGLPGIPAPLTIQIPHKVQKREAGNFSGNIRSHLKDKICGEKINKYP